jgi:hypothetical protein
MPTKSIFASKTIWGALIPVVATLAPMALNKAGITNPSDQQALLSSLATVAGAGLAVYGRFKATQGLH